MRLTPWMLPFALSAALLTTTGYALADSHDAEGEQHEPLDDAALEEEYGIKAGSVKRDEETSSSSADDTDEQARAREAEKEKNEEVATSEGEADVELAPGSSEERSPEAGTGGTGSPEDAIHSSEEENSKGDEEGADDSE